MLTTHAHLLQFMLEKSSPIFFSTPWHTMVISAPMSEEDIYAIGSQGPAGRGTNTLAPAGTRNNCYTSFRVVHILFSHFLLKSCYPLPAAVISSPSEYV